MNAGNREYVRETVLTYESDCPPAPDKPPLLHWIPLTPLEQMERTEYDAIIVGSGAGGGAVLWRLCEQWRNSGKRIALIEAGDLLLQDHIYNLPTFNPELIDRYLNNPYYSYLPGKDWPEFPGAKLFFGLGGRTLHWGTVSPRMNPVDFADWPVTYNELLPYYLIAERIMNVNLGYPTGSSVWNTVLNRLQQIGFADAETIPRAVDLQPSRLGYLHSNPFFSSLIFMAYALNLGGFDLTVKAPVTQVLTDRGKAVGVKAVTPDGKEHYIRGKTVVLSAGAFQNPRILYNSGIRPEALGHYLVNHSFIIARSTANREQFPENLGVLEVMIPRTAERPFQIQIHGPALNIQYHYREVPLLKELEIFFLGFGRIEPRYDNYVYIDGAIRNAYGLPGINVNYSYSERDKAVISQVANNLNYIIPRLGFELPSNPCLMPAGADYHEAGTCRMGNNPNVSVTNRFGQVHHISGLYVADSSVLPSIGAANPTLTIVAVATRTADYIVRQG